MNACHWDPAERCCRPTPPDMHPTSISLAMQLSTYGSRTCVVQPRWSRFHFRLDDDRPHRPARTRVQLSQRVPATNVLSKRRKQGRCRFEANTSYIDSKGLI